MQINLIIKKEAHFAFGFIALSGVDKLSQSIYANLKVKYIFNFIYSSEEKCRFFANFVRTRFLISIKM